MTNQPLDKIIQNCDLVIASNITTAIIDPFFLGIPIIQIQDGERLNHSPLRGDSNIKWASNYNDLKFELSSLQLEKNKPPKELFFLEKKLSRWEKIFHDVLKL